MATRRERVIIDLDDRFTAPMARATAATSMFRREVDSSGKSVIAFDKTTRDTSPSIDRLSGRLNILARAAAALGPGLVPITTAAVPAIAGLTTQLGFAAAGAGTAMLAFNGVGKALEAFREAQVAPTEANLAKMREEMSKLGPEAQEFVRYLDDVMPVLQRLRESAQAGWLPGVQEGIDGLLSRAPQLRRVLFEISDAAGDLLGAAGQDLGSARWDEFFDFLETEARPELTKFGQTVGNLASGLAELWMAFDPLSDDFTSGLLRMSEGFERWASGLSETQGFEDFLAYIRQTGPQVLDLLGSLVDMLVQVGTAVAPLGGPVLTILTKVADVVAAIAASDLGTPLLGAVSAMSALSLASRGFTTVMGSGAVASVKGVSSSLKTMGDVGVVAWGRTAAEAERYNKAQGRIKATAASMGKGAALVGGMALATSDLGQGLGLTNTASLALMGTMAGPWGAAIGAGTGLVLDLAAANDNLESAIDGARQALDSTQLSWIEQRAAVEQARAELDAWNESQNVANAMASGGFGEKVTGYWNRLSDTVFRTGERGKKAVEGMEAELRQMPGAISASEEAWRKHKAAIDANIDSMRALREERLRARNAELNYEASIDDAREAAEKNGKTLDKTTDKGRENWRALLSLAEGWNGLSDRMQNAEGAHRRAIGTFVAVATQMGMNADKARDLARRLLEIPAERHTRLTVDTGPALAEVAAVRAALGGIPRSIAVSIVAQRRGDWSGSGPGLAGGGTVPGQRYPYGDKVLAYLAPGEEVISNRHGQADRHRELLQRINANQYANGGTVSHSSVTNNHYGTSGPMVLTGRLRTDSGWVDIEGVVDNRIDAGRRHDRVTGRR